ncbi:hypothetical protein Tco_1267165 [Tanacetum coccineum]
MSIQDMEDLKQQYLDEMKSLINTKDYRDEKIDIKIYELKENFNGTSIEINKKKKLQQLEQVANLSTHHSRFFNSFCYDDDDDDDDDDKEYIIAITPVLSTEKPDNSLSMGDEHLNTIPKTESDELIKSSDENLVLIPSESEDFSHIESECDVPDCDDSQTTNFSKFSNPLFDDSTSSDDYKFNLIHNEDLDSTSKNDRFDTKSYLLESLFNRDTLMASSPKIDSLLDEFADELKTIPPGIVNTDHEEYISMMERLLYDNSTPRPPKAFQANSDTIIESLPTFPIPVEDSDSLMEEIDLFLTPDDSMPPGIENDDYDSEGDILFLEELLSNDSSSLPENESFHFNISSSPRPPAKPPDDGIYFEPDKGILTVKVVGNISEHHVLTPRLLPTQPTLASNEEKSSHFLSHRGFKAFQLFSESPMMIYGGDIPILDVPYLHFYPP